MCFFWELHQFGGHSQCSAHTAGCLDREMLLALPQCQEISEVSVMLWAPSLSGMPGLESFHLCFGALLPGENY